MLAGQYLKENTDILILLELKHHIAPLKKRENYALARQRKCQDMCMQWFQISAVLNQVLKHQQKDKNNCFGVQFLVTAMLCLPKYMDLIAANETQNNVSGINLQ